MYHKHKPFLCPRCKKEQKSLLIGDVYETDDGSEGSYVVQCVNCGYKLGDREMHDIGIFDNIGKKFGTESEYFPVNTICRDDLKEYIAAKNLPKLTDEKMQEIAGKLGDGLLECCYWDVLKGVLEYFGLIKD